MERALHGYLADKPGEGGSSASSTGPSQPAAAELPPPKASEGKSPGRRGKKGGVQIAEPPAAAPPRSTESLARKVEAAAMSQLREELPVGVWIEVKYLPPARDGVDQGSVLRRRRIRTRRPFLRARRRPSFKSRSSSCTIPSLTASRW